MRIDPDKHGWMTAPETRAVMAALGEARFVGGAVRNALLEVAVIDIDIAVPLPPEEAQKRLEAAHIKVVPTGFDHGTITAILNDRVFEVTSLRRDIDTDGRHAVVAYTIDWAQDAARRDFTMNALYAGPDGEIFDYEGGVEDLIAGSVRFVGDAATRIKEDYLRILRLFRFHAWYGRGEIDGAALRAAAEARAGLAQLSGERIAKEFLRLLECPNPVPVLRVMAASGILTVLLPGALDLARLENLIHVDADNFFVPDALLRLAALLPDAASEEGAETARAVADRLKLSNADRARLAELTSPPEKIVSYLPLPEVRKFLYRIGAAAFKDRVRLRWAASPRGAGAIAWRMLLSVADSWEKPRFPLSGRDVMAAGLPEGPRVGQLLNQIEQEWIDSDFALDDAALAARLQALARAGA